MKKLNLSPFKRLLMVVLVAISNVCLGTKLSYGLSVIGLPNESYADSCVSWCVSIVGVPNGMPGRAMLTWPNVTNGTGLSFVPAACYCANAREVSMLAFASNGSLWLRVACSSIAMFSPITCVFSVLGTVSGGGGSTTVNCGYGQYKNGNTCYNCPAGKYANVINTATCVSCANGYYAAGTGNSTCTPCAKGRYGNGTAASVCTVCPSMAVYVATSANGAIAGSVALGGTTAQSGTGAITGCYFPAISVGQMVGSGLYFQGFYDPTGHVWDCNGVSMGYK